VTTQATIETRPTQVGDHVINLLSAGDPASPAILLLHGAGPGATARGNWVSTLQDLSDEYYCLAPDMLGFGDSSHPEPPPQGIVAFTELRVGTLLQLLDVLGVGKASLIGNSMGGLVSLSVIREAPERVDKMVLMGAAGAPVPPGPGLAPLVGFYDDPSPESMAAVLRGFVYDQSTFGGDFDAQVKTRLEIARRPEVERSHRATFDLSTMWQFSDNDFAAITQHVLIIHGREDRILDFAGSMYFFQRIANARLLGLSKCGHWAQIDQHAQFITAVRGFLSGRL
jgi:2-hydroxymuconate-semialdehyde hydrolase